MIYLPRYQEKYHLALDQPNTHKEIGGCGSGGVKGKGVISVTP